MQSWRPGELNREVSRLGRRKDPRDPSPAQKRRRTVLYRANRGASISNLHFFDFVTCPFYSGTGVEAPTSWA
jgi:hypothetical protein